MASSDNLDPHKFEKGNSGNPKGRPKGSKNLSTALKDALGRLAPDSVVDAKFIREFCKGRKRVTVADALAARLIFDAIKGEAWAFKEIGDRTEGRPTPGVTVDIPGDGSNECAVKIYVGIDPDKV